MAETSKITGALQENVLTLLCFSDKFAPIVSASVKPSLFENRVYREIAGRAQMYWQKYHRAAGEHLPDLCEDLLEGRTGFLYARAFQDMREFNAKVNGEYVINQLRSFIRQQSLKIAITEAADAVQKGQLDKAERSLLDGVKTRLDAFDPGLSLARTAFRVNIEEDERIFTGISAMDKDGICPAPKELMILLALASRGKSWGLISIGKFAALQRKRVAHVTLEMSARKVHQRYLQSYFGISRRQAEYVLADLKSDKQGVIEDVTSSQLVPARTFQDVGIRQFILSRARRLPSQMQIMVKEFPTSMLTIDGLRAYLDMLELHEDFVPDLLIVDYADLMQMDAEMLRIETGRIYKELRGLAVERNLAVVTASQSNRDGENARTLGMKHLAEDFSKAMVADVIVSYNQTEHEKKYNLARLGSLKARDEISGKQYIISQAYSIGQFCLDSSIFDHERYWPLIGAPEIDAGKGRHKRSSGRERVAVRRR